MTKSNILKPPEGTIQVTMRLPEGLLERLNVIATRFGHSRSEVMGQFLNWAATKFEEEQDVENSQAKRRVSDGSSLERSGAFGRARRGA